MMVNQIRRNGEKMEEVRVVEKVLQSLSLKFVYVVAVVEESKDLNTMTINELMTTSEIHEQRMKKRAVVTAQEQAL